MNITHKPLLPLLICFIFCGCAAIRTDIIKPALSEELAWNKMLKDWSLKAYTSRDFRTGFLSAATKPFTPQLSGSLNVIIQDLTKAGDPDSDDFKAGAFGGATLAMYGIAQGEGIKWIFNQLANFGILPAAIFSSILGI